MTTTLTRADQTKLLKRQAFQEAFKAEFPEEYATGIINRKQMDFVSIKHDLPYPRWLRDQKTTGKAGHFQFTLGFDVEDMPPIPVVVTKVKESDEDIDKRIEEAYETLSTLVTGVAENKIRSLIVSGAAGVGKSYETKQTLEAHGKSDYVFVNGYLKNSGLFKLLYDNRFENQVVIIDDSDKILTEMDSISMLKNALELKQTRTISWLSEKQFISEETGEPIPKTFQYEGSMIFLTNMDFQAQIQKDTILSPHLAALDSRSIYLDLKIKNRRDILARIKQVINESDILTSKGIYEYEQQILMQYLTDNLDNLKELSLRTIEKLASLYTANPDKWRSLSDAVMLKR